MLVAMIACHGMPALAQSGKYAYKRKKGDKWVVVDRIEFRSGSYRITKKGNTFPLSRDKVYMAVGPKPVHFDKWATALRGGSPNSEAIRGMESVVVSCAMLGWDKKALGYLLPAYDTQKAYTKIDKACKKYERLAGVSLPGELQGYHWKALIALGKPVQDKLNAGKASGSRALVAAAYLAQGDLHRKRRRPDEAMYEGYLRVILCCSDVKALQPEALFRAWETLKAKGDGRHEKFRAKLLADHPQSQYARMVRDN
jgi:hypothetical protein